MTLFSSLSSFCLKGPFLGPSDGSEIKKCVILLHGWGANGANLIELGKAWGPLLPGTLFFAPNAPTSLSHDGISATDSYQWFPFDPNDLSSLSLNIRNALPILRSLIQEIQKAFSLKISDIALVGFSQGAVLALDLALNDGLPLAGIVGYSGGIFGTFSAPFSSPPLCLIHGDQDFVIPPEALQKAVQFLTHNTISHEAHLLKGLEHTISHDGIEIGGKFLKTCLYGDTRQT